MYGKAAVLTLPALGEDVQLGMLYDARSFLRFNNAALWSDDDIKENQETTVEQVQNAEYKMLVTLDKARDSAGLDAQVKLFLDMGMLTAKGSAEYLSGMKTWTFDARVDVTCTIVRQTRRIPQEKLAKMYSGGSLSRFTHFVAEVVEGGTATLSFSQACTSAEEMKQVQGELEANIKAMPIWGQAKIDKTESIATSENLSIRFRGASAERVSNMQDAHRVASSLPAKLVRQMSTLSYTLVPVSVLDSNVKRPVRELDPILVKRTSRALAAAETVRLDLHDVLQEALAKGSFPTIQQQIRAFKEAFTTASTNFTKDVRRLLAKLRDGTKNYGANAAKLRQSIALFEQRTRFASVFASKKHHEARVLAEKIGPLFTDGFEDHVSNSAEYKPVFETTPRLMITLGGSSIDLEVHPLQKMVESHEMFTHHGRDSASDDDSELPLDWFEDTRHLDRFAQSWSKLRNLRSRLFHWDSNVVFGVARITSARLPGMQKSTRTEIGDIVLDFNEKPLTIVTYSITGKLKLDNRQFTPVVSNVTYSSVSVELPWGLRGEHAEMVMPTKMILLHICAKRNPKTSGLFSRASVREVPDIVTIDMDHQVAKHILSNLKEDCNYEVRICLLSIVGPSKWSHPATVRTMKSSSVAVKTVKVCDRTWGNIRRWFKTLGCSGSQTESYQ